MSPEERDQQFTRIRLALRVVGANEALRALRAIQTELRVLHQELRACRIAAGELAVCECGEKEIQLDDSPEKAAEYERDWHRDAEGTELCGTCWSELLAQPNGLVGKVEP